MRHRSLLLLTLLGTAASTGCGRLVAGPEVAATTPVPASRDSAYARARRGLSAEAFTMDKVDSSQGHLTGTRYPSSSAKLGTQAICRVVLAMDVTGSGEASEVTTRTRWVAPGAMEDKAPEVCDQERKEVLERIDQTLVPPAAQ